MRSSGLALVIEDAPSWQSVLSALLEAAGWSVRIATSYGEARAELSKRAFDVALVDLALASSVDADNLDGVTILKLLSEGDIPAIVISARAGVDVVNGIFTENPPFGFIDKTSFDADRFRQTLAEVKTASCSRISSYQKELLTPYATEGTMPQLTSISLTELLRSLSTRLFIRYEAIAQVIAEGLQRYAGLIGYLTDHGEKHVQNLIESLELLIPDDTKGRLNAQETFLLLCAAHFHDVGLLYEKHPDEDWLAVRKDHPERTYDYIHEYYQDWGLSKAEAYALQNICLGHSGDTLYELPEDVMISHSRVRIRFLSALLRLADELDVDYTRVSRYIMQLKQIPPESLQHWIKHEDISGVNINSRSWTIEIHAMPRNDEVKALLQEMVADKIQRELDYMRPILERHGIFYRHIEMKYVDFGDLRTMH